MSWMHSIIMTVFTLFVLAVTGVAAYALLNDPRPGAWIALLVVVGLNTIFWLTGLVGMMEAE